MNFLRFYVSWCGERAAGINPGSEEVTITFKHGQPFDGETVEYWDGVLREFFDGANVELMEMK